MTAKELKTFLSNSFKEKLSPFGFNKIGNNYVLTEDGMTYSFTFNSLNYDNSYPTSFSAFFGFLIVNRVLRSALGEDKRKVDKIKVAGQIYLRQVALWEQGKYPCKNYDLYNLQEADNAVTEMVVYFLNDILPEFKKIDSLIDLDQLFNTGEYIQKSKRVKRDIMYALIVAKLVANPNYYSLCKNYQKRINHFSEWDKKELNTLIKYLESADFSDNYNPAPSSSPAPNGN